MSHSESQHGNRPLGPLSPCHQSSIYTNPCSILLMLPWTTTDSPSHPHTTGKMMVSADSAAPRVCLSITLWPLAFIYLQSTGTEIPWSARIQLHVSQLKILAKLSGDSEDYFKMPCWWDGELYMVMAIKQHHSLLFIHSWSCDQRPSEIRETKGTVKAGNNSAVRPHLWRETVHLSGWWIC